MRNERKVRRDLVVVMQTAELVALPVLRRVL
jgi:hypothetical protein